MNISSLHRVDSRRRCGKDKETNRNDGSSKKEGNTEALVHCRKDKSGSWGPTKVKEILLQGKITESRSYSIL